MLLEELDMKLTKCRIGDCIELYHNECGIKNLTTSDVSGINRDKEFFEPSKQVGADTSKYKLVPPDHFACNLMHVGRDKVLPIALNHSSSNKYVSPAYTVFKIKDESVLLREYFFMMLKSDERDRYFWFHTDSSVRDGMSWNDFCELEFLIPNIVIQKKYVDIYNGILKNQLSYECSLEELKLVCDAYIENLKKDYPLESVSQYLEERTEVNSGIKYKDLIGVGNDGFITPRGSRAESTFNKCKIFYYRDFVYNPSVVSKGAIVLNLQYRVPKICTEEYIVFYISNEKKLIPEYLFLWLKRNETGRYLDFMNIDSVRNRVYFKDLDDIRLPIPNLKLQKDISNMYLVYNHRKMLNEKLKRQIKKICPILIKGSIIEAKSIMEA